ncbi:Dyp-type peroxidase [Rhodococcus opacus]|uniref:Peroxidase n=1 Tax=Rhodococcus opacus TaxID=37919 RepID=A0A076F1C7_RHOOP|nr:Dyp-type peroxidase [Rhodococcus opacus]AII11207.1 peroxidase [Rhodococcus opacus]
MAECENPSSRGVSRRRLLGGGAAALGATGLGWGTHAVADRVDPTAAIDGGLTEPFFGTHQAGIATPAQAHAQFVGLDLRPGARPATLIGIMKVWTDDAARLANGAPALADTEPELAAAPARLTVTIGLGPGAFAAADVVGDQPPWLRPLPAFPIDQLDDGWGQTDVLLQVCADDQMAVAHAVRVLLKNVRSLVTVRWSQHGFRHARRSHTDGTTMRNLMGQVDGTVNPDPATDFDELVWDDGAGVPWLAGGTSLVLRRIRMELDTWEEIDRSGRELIVGRTLDTGAPLTGSSENDEPDFAATDRYGIPVIPPSSHIARSQPFGDHERFHRRAYNYDDAPGPGQTSNSGLIFAAYQRDVDAQFLPVQQRLAEFDALNQWTTPIGSAVYAIPPGVTSAADYLGSSLLDGRT